MNISLKSINFAALNTIALWILVLVVGGWLLFKPDPALNKDTVGKLVSAVESISAASDNITRVANEQRQWNAILQEQAMKERQKRDKEYEDLYDKYKYTNESKSTTLDELYGDKLRKGTTSDGSKQLRGNENGTGQAGTVPKPNSKP